MEIAAVVFDMDGVLCDSEPFLYRASKRMFAETYGLHVNRKDFSPFVGTGEDRYLSGVAESYGIQLNMPADKLRTYELYLELIDKQLEPLPGVHFFIERCLAADLDLAVATSADRVKMEGNLKQIRIPLALFKACVTGSEVKKKKPAPDIFVAAINSLKVEPCECLVIEDSPSGVRAASLAGASPLGLLTSFDREALLAEGAVWTAPDLTQIPEDLLRILFDHSQGRG